MNCWYGTHFLAEKRCVQNAIYFYKKFPSDQFPSESNTFRSIPTQVVRHFCKDLFFCWASFSYGFNFCMKRQFWTSIHFCMTSLLHSLKLCEYKTIFKINKTKLSLNFINVKIIK